MFGQAWSLCPLFFSRSLFLHAARILSSSSVLLFCSHSVCSSLPWGSFYLILRSSVAAVTPGHPNQSLCPVCVGVQRREVKVRRKNDHPGSQVHVIRPSSISLLPICHSPATDVAIFTSLRSIIFVSQLIATSFLRPCSFSWKFFHALCGKRPKGGNSIVDDPRCDTSWYELNDWWLLWRRRSRTRERVATYSRKRNFSVFDSLVAVCIMLATLSSHFPQNFPTKGKAGTEPSISAILKRWPLFNELKKADRWTKTLFFQTHLVHGVRKPSSSNMNAFSLVTLNWAKVCTLTSGDSNSGQTLALEVLKIKESFSKIRRLETL